MRWTRKAEITWLIVLVIFCSLVFNACAGATIHVQDPVSTQLWTDAPGQPDPLEECRRLTEGDCCVMSVEALAWWQTRWAACEELLEKRNNKGDE